MVTRIETALLRGLEKERIEYFYQPLYNTLIGRIDKAEVLLRVRDETGGYFDTEELVTAAEEMGLIDEMDRQAFIHTCGVLPEFRAHGVEELSVNLSPAACHAARLIPEVRRILTETGTEPGHICLEITEVAKILDEERMFEVMRVLYNMGVKLALDDFGKGYSNFQRLISMPFHILKLDKALIWSLGTGSMAESLLDSMVHFAIENEITVVAEGVETAREARFLKDIGCHYLQGYYFGEPMPQEKFFQTVAQHQGGAVANPACG